MMPLAAAVSIRLIAAASALSSSWPALASMSTALERVRNSERIARFRIRRFWFCRFRLIWLLIFAIGEQVLTTGIVRDDVFAQVVS